MVVVRYLGRACVEIISDNDHIVIDPNFVELPRKGVNKILLSHEHDDHLSNEDILKIYEKYARENKQLKIFGPKSTKEKVAFEKLYVVKAGTVIDLKDGKIDVYSIDCWGADSCLAYLVNIDGKRILHTADSANYSDRLRNIEKAVDCCFVACFEDYYDNYLHFVKTILPKLAVPYHFGPDEMQMGENLVEYFKKNYLKVELYNPGEEISI
ncbi:MAG: hypothetical protein GF311_18270 [Candidatus Lokiarchaeota archaeon]|nr:hypothetical protein [Candidatus Lokiarchaeota archaeon]